MHLPGCIRSSGNLLRRPHEGYHDILATLQIRIEWPYEKEAQIWPGSRVTATSTLTVRLDSDSKQVLVKAAELRQISLSDYVRIVTVSQARREVAGAQQQSIHMTPSEQPAFWQALQSPPQITQAQNRLGSIMRGEP